MATELATAYIALVPSLSGAKGKIESELSGINLSKPSKSMGAKLTHGIGGALKNVAKIGTVSIGAIGTAVSGLSAVGGVSRALKLDQAQFKFKALGMDVEGSMASCNDAVKGTAFGLDAAATVATQLGAAGVASGDSMTGALKSVAGVAAMSGSSMEDVGSIFAKVAAKGKVGGDELLQLNQRGINGTAALAKHLGVTSEEVTKMVSRGQVDFATFSAAMEETFGEAASGANATFQGAMSNVMSALSRVGAKFTAPALDGLRRVFVALIPAIDAISKALDPVVAVFAKFVDGAATKAVSVIEAFTGSLSAGQGIAGAFSAAIGAAFGNVENAGDVGADFIQVVDTIGTSLSGLADAIAPMLSQMINDLLPVIVQMASNLLPVIVQMINDLLPVIVQMVGAIAPLVSMLVAALAPILTQIIDAIVQMAPAIMQIIGVIAQVIAALAPIIAMLIETLVPIITQIIQLVLEIASQVMAVVLPVISMILEAVQSAMPLIQGIIQAAMGVIQQVITTVWPIIQAYIESAMDVIKMIIDNVWPVIQSIIETVMHVIQDVISIVTAAISGDWSGVWNGIKKLFSDIWEGIKNTAKNAIDGVFKIVTGIKDKIIGFFSGAGKWLIDAGKSIVQGLIDGLKKMFGPIGDAVGGLMDFVGGFFPHSPAKRGAFSGKGWTLYSGQAISEALGEGVKRKGGKAVKAVSDVMGAMSDVKFGPPALAFGGEFAVSAQKSISKGGSSLTKADVYDAMAAALSPLADREVAVYVDGRRLAGAIAPQMDAEFGQMQARRGR